MGPGGLSRAVDAAAAAVGDGLQRGRLVVYGVEVTVS